MSLNLIILNIVLYFIYLMISIRFSNKLRLIDYPTKIKNHPVPTPAIGGLIFFFIYLTIYLELFLNFKLNDFYHYLTFFSFLIFLIGYFDDLNDNNPYIKSFLFILIIFIFLFFNQEILIKTISISFVYSTYEISTSFSYIFTILCFWLLMNSFNLTDGLNGIAISYALIIFISIFLIFNLNDFDYFIVLNFIFILFLSLIFNLKNKIFLGNNGAYLISFFISVFLIKFYNETLSDIKFDTDRIFLMLMIPGIDMLRLFIFRIKDKKNPFTRDQNHLHHYLKKKVSQEKVFILYAFLISVPIILDNIFKNMTIFLILIQIVLYIFMINRLKN